jgi:hypothetical protein
MAIELFGYQALLKNKDRSEVSSLIAYQAPARSALRAVMWSVPDRRWVYAPATAVDVMFDDSYRDQIQVIDRTAAQRIAVEHLHTELPDELSLQEMCDEGAKLNQPWGPPMTQRSAESIALEHHRTFHIARTTFAYQAVLSEDETTITSLIAYQAPARSKLRAVIWSVSRKIWTYNPGVAAGILYDDQEQKLIRPVDKASAERIARENLATELPTEETLLAMCEQGEEMGWVYGPPRT